MAFGVEFYNALPEAMHPWTHLVFALLGLFVFFNAKKIGIKPTPVEYFFLVYSIGELGNSLMHFGILAWGFAHLIQEASLFFGLLAILYWGLFQKKKGK